MHRINFLFLFLLLCSCTREHKEYYPDGKLKAIGPLKDGKLNGIAKYFYEDGILESQIPFKNGKINGELLKFYGNKKLKRSFQYKNDTLNGIAKEYYENGGLHFITPFERGKKEGHAQAFDCLGHLIADVNYENDTISAFNDYDSSGKITNTNMDMFFIVSDNKFKLGEEYKADVIIEGHYIRIERIEMIVKTNNRKVISEILPLRGISEGLLKLKPNKKGKYQIEVVASIIYHENFPVYEIRKVIPIEVL